MAVPLLEYTRLAIESIRGQLLRSWLTMIGILIGVATIIALVSLGQGLQDLVDAQFETVGANRIIITPGGGGLGLTSSPIAGEMVTAELTDRDLDEIRKVPGVEAIGVFVEPGVPVSFHGKTRYLYLVGISTDPDTIREVKSIGFFDVIEGRYFDPGDHGKAAVGYSVAFDDFPWDIRPGDKIIVGDSQREYRVIGIYKKVGAEMHDHKVTVPIEEALEITGRDHASYGLIGVRVENPDEVEEKAEEIKKRLRRLRGVGEGEEDFSVTTSKRVKEQLDTVLGIVRVFLLSIAAISLVVGGIGVMNTMYTSIFEKTREIGIMKAIGARNTDILVIFLIEAGLLGVAGGGLGVVLGIGIARLVEHIALLYGVDMLRASVTPQLVLGGLAFSFLVGVISGITPARNAARMNPVEALRFQR